MGGAVSPQLEKANMFKIEKTNYVVTAALFFALICAVFGA